MRLHHSLLVAITILVLVCSVVFPVPARADGEPPVEPVPTGLTPTDFPLPVDPALVAEAAAPETDPAPVVDGLQPTNFPLPVDPAAVQAETAADSASTAPVEPAQSGLTPTDFPVSADNNATETQPASVPEILASIPPETSLALVDASGDLQALGSAAGAEILINGDPTWCPGSSLPGSVGCVGPYASFAQLLANLGGASGAGTIYVAANYDSAAEQAYTGLPGPGEITFNADSLTTLTDLTIQGGWDFTQGKVIGTSTLANYGLIVGVKGGTPWNGSVTIRDLLIQDAPERGLTVNASGDVVLENVSVDGSNTTRTNNRTGMYVSTSGNLTATDVSASGALSQNGYVLYGAALFAGNSIDVVRGSFDGNQGFGLLVQPGTIPQAGTYLSLSQVSINANWSDGLTINNYSNTDNQASVNGDFNGNGGLGIRVNTIGSLTLNNVQALGNGQGGLSIFTDNSSAQISLVDTSANWNNATGLTITGNGNVSLDRVSASNNRYSGAGIYLSQGNANLSNSSFSNNGGSGLEVTQDGPAWNTLTLNAVTASGNQGGDGADLRMANGSIAINGGNFSYNQGDGFYAHAYGNGRDGGFPGAGSVTVQNVTASGNRYDGGYIVMNAQQGIGPSVVSAPVTVSSSTFDANSNWGIDIEAGGSVTLNSVLARGNAYSGAWLGSGYDGLGGSIAVQNSTMTGNGEFGIDADPWGGIVSNPARDGALFLNTVVLTGNSWGCYEALSGRAEEINVLCAILPTSNSGGETETETRSHKPPVRPAGGSVQSAELPVNSQLVESGAAILLDCDQFSATFLKLKSSAGAFLACPVQEKGQLNSFPQEKLPGDVPAASTFVQALGVDLIFAGAPLPAMAIGGQITVQFPLPAGSEGKKLAILFWDPSLKSGAGDWVELPMRNLKADGLDQTFPLRTPPDGLLVLAGVYQENGLIKVTTNFPGLFMLVTK